MKSNIEFKTLLNQLPMCPGAIALPMKNDPAGFMYIEAGLPEFVGPDLAASDLIKQPSKPKVLIISAAGAVGKSTLANEIACAKRAPIWDLAQAAAVGGNSMTGQLTASFGFELAGQVSAKLMGGELFLIVDALDEARVKANEAGFDAFIQNIAKIARNTNGTSFVLLCRTQTAENTWLLLAEAGVPTSLLSIRPFTREQAELYIEARIQHMDEAAKKLISDHRQPFVEARDLILHLLKRAVGGNGGATEDAVREFLGYAPVLETVSVLLGTEGNFQELIGSLTAMNQEPGGQMNRPLAVLEHVVTRLLERERTQKLLHNIRPVLEEVAKQNGWSNWSSLYSADEQRTRLLGMILGRTFNTCPDMPAAVRAVYEAHLAVWLPEHPFLREGKDPANKVFESYLFAIAMREHLTPMSKDVEQRIAAVDYKPSRLLADFYIMLGEQRGNKVVAKRQIGYLYDSLIAGETADLQIRLSVDAGDPDEDDDDEAGVAAEGEFELVYATSEGEGREQTEVRRFRIEEKDDAISFRRQLKDATIVTCGSVSLGGLSDDFEIGPGVDIRCDKLKIHSTGLVVRGAARVGEKTAPVTLEARNCESRVVRMPLVRGSLTVSWPGALAHPWTKFAGPPTERCDDARMQKVNNRFRRIVLTLQSHKQGGLARLHDKVENRRVLKGHLGEALLEKLVKDGIMELRERLYHWMPEKANDVLQVSWQDLRNRKISQQMREYFKQFIENNKRLFD